MFDSYILFRSIFKQDVVIEILRNLLQISFASSEKYELLNFYFFKKCICTSEHLKKKN
jgi:hypothetical protein